MLMKVKNDLIALLSIYSKLNRLDHLKIVQDWDKYSFAANWITCRSMIKSFTPEI